MTSVFKYVAPVKLVTKNRPPIGLDYVELFEKGIISREEARAEMGMAENVQFKKQEQKSEENPFGWNDDKDIAVFEQFGESKETFEIETFEFASALGLMILQFLQGSQGLVIADLIENIKAPAEDIVREVERLSQDNMIESDGDALKVSERGSNELEENNITTELEVRYEYAKAFGISGSEIIPTSRDFCVRLSSLNRLYTREEIDQMSAIVGYDVWRRRGGWMTIKGTDNHVPYCRHIWRSRLVRKKI